MKVTEAHREGAERFQRTCEKLVEMVDLGCRLGKEESKGRAGGRSGGLGEVDVCLKEDVHVVE